MPRLQEPHIGFSRWRDASGNVLCSVASGVAPIWQEHAHNSAFTKSCEKWKLQPGSIFGFLACLPASETADLVQRLVYSMAARSADEGRSFLSKPGGGTKLGERLLSEAVTITSDPANADAPDLLFGPDGVPKRRTVWFERGVAKTMSYSRFWAQKMGREPVPFAFNLSMAGGAVPIEDMIRAVKRGILVTRLWYVNVVDPRTLLCTGMTRDGNFLIENGTDHAARAQPSLQRKPPFRVEQDRSRGPRRATWRWLGHGLSAAAPDLRVHLLITIERHLRADCEGKRLSERQAALAASADPWIGQQRSAEATRKACGALALKNDGLSAFKANSGHQPDFRGLPAAVG